MGKYFYVFDGFSIYLKKILRNVRYALPGVLALGCPRTRTSNFYCLKSEVFKQSCLENGERHPYRDKNNKSSRITKAITKALTGSKILTKT